MIEQGLLSCPAVAVRIHDALDPATNACPSQFLAQPEVIDPEMERGRLSAALPVPLTRSLFEKAFVKALRKHSGIKKQVENKVRMIMEQPLAMGEPLKGASDLLSHLGFEITPRRRAGVHSGPGEEPTSPGGRR